MNNHPHSENQFEHNTNVGIIGRGETVETCFSDIARVMFSLVTNVNSIHLTNIINFEFEEENVEIALVTWLNLLIIKSKEHHLLFGDFRLKREGNLWHATVSGAPVKSLTECGFTVKSVTKEMLSVKKFEHVWEAHCVIDI